MASAAGSPKDAYLRSLMLIYVGPTWPHQGLSERKFCLLPDGACCGAVAICKSCEN